MITWCHHSALLPVPLPMRCLLFHPSIALINPQLVCLLPMKRLSLKLFVFPFTGDPANRVKRPKTEQLIDLAYYQGQLANSPQEPPRSASPVKLGPSITRAASPSSSEYSCDSDDAAPQPQSRPATRALNHARRTSALSDAGTDRRRLAIVQMDKADQGRPKAVSEHGHSARSRSVAESNLTGLAIVAPPDASPSAYIHLSPPTSATRVDHSKARKHSEVNVSKKLPSRPSSSSKSFKGSQPSTSDLPGSVVDQPLITPPIGQTKDIHVPVAAPVVVNLEPSRPLNIAKSKSSRDVSPAPPITAQSSSESTSKRADVSYLHYQPGTILSRCTSSS